MKKLLATLALALIATVCHGQGTIAFGNSALTRAHVRDDRVSDYDPLLSIGFKVGVFYGPAGSSPEQLVLAPGLARFGTTLGVLINAPSVFPLPGTEPGQIVSLQIRAWNEPLGAARNYYGETDVRQVTLGPTAGPGTIIWQGATGTNPNRFRPLIIEAIPEPSMLALGLLSSLLLFLRHRNSTNK